MTIQALEAGKHVLVEKPMACNVAQAQEMIAARDRTDKTLMVGMNQRFTPQHYAAKRLIEQGELGDLYYGRTRWLRQVGGTGLWNRGGWFLDPQQSGGGPMLDLGIHRLDLALHMLGFPEVESVYGQSFYGLGRTDGLEMGCNYAIEDAAAGLVRFADGGALFIEASYYLNHHEERAMDTQLYGTKGGIILGETIRPYRLEDKVVDVEIEPDETAPRSCVEHFARVLRGEEELVPTAEQGLIGLAIVQGLYRSAETGAAVRIDQEG
jgi:predicted dehydrogenase